MDYIAHFKDGSSSPVTDLHWSPEFTTGLAHRGDGFSRCVFIDQRIAHTHHRDPWVHRIERTKSHRWWCKETCSAYVCSCQESPK